MYINFLHETFYCLSGAVLVFSGLELAWPGLVLAYININWVLIFWLVNGIVILIIKPESEQ